MYYRKNTLFREDITIVLVLFVLAFLFGRESEPTEIPNGYLDLSQTTIVIDPGHGGRDPGAPGYSGTWEKEITLPISLKLMDMLESAGANVIMTRTTDKTVSLSERVTIVNTSGADLFVSIHCDWNQSSLRKGSAVFYYNKPITSGKDELLASIIQSNLVRSLNSNDLGYHNYNHFVTSRTNIPAVIVEAAFMTNPVEEELIQTPEYRERVAKGVFNGIIEYIERTN